MKNKTLVKRLKRIADIACRLENLLYELPYGDKRAESLGEELADSIIGLLSKVDKRKAK